MKRVEFIFLVSFIITSSLFSIPKAKAENQVVVNNSSEGQIEQSGTGTRFETGSVNPMWGGAGEYTFQTYFIDPQKRNPDFVKIYLLKGGDNEFENFLMTKETTSNKGVSYFFKKTISEKNEGIYQFYFEAKIDGKLIHGPSYGGSECKPGGCGTCCGVWGGPKILSSKVIEDNKIYLFESGKNKPLISYDIGKNWLTSVDISPDEKYFAAADNNQNLYLFEIASKSLKWKYTGNPVGDTGNLGMDKGLISFSGNDHLAVSLKGVVFLFDTKSENPIWSYPTGAVLNGLAISDDGKFIAAGGRDTYVYLWSTENSTPVWKHKIEAKGGMMGGSVIRSLSMTSDGKYFVVGTSCPDRSIHVFSPQSSNPVFKAKVGINFPVESVAISDDGQNILAGGGGSPEDPYSSVFYKFKQEKPLWVFNTSLNPVNEVAISKDGVYCAIGSNMDGIFVNKCANEKSLWKIKDTGYIGSLSFSEDGKYFSVGTGTNHVLLVSIDKKKIINDWETTGKAESSKISTSGKYVAAGTGLNRFFIISGEGENNSGAGTTELKNVKPKIVEATDMITKSSNENQSRKNVFVIIKDWFSKIFSLIVKNKNQKAVTTENCGNGLCEPDLGENKDSCLKDCNPSN